jgi:hypothetical protein
MKSLVAQLVDLSARAAAQTNARREAATKKGSPTMDSTARILRSAAEIGVSSVTKLITDYAKRLYPTMTRERGGVRESLH